MTAETIDVFALPVFADANIWSMWPSDKLNELAEDIKDNGFDHRYPITIAEVEGVMMLLDGRNRREAAKIAGIVPPVIVTDVDPKLAVHRSNNQNRDATPGQKAMATAMAFPEAKRGMHSELKNLTGSAKVYLSQARYVLRNNPIPEGEHYPQRCLAIMAGTLSLTEAYDLTQADVKKREEEEAIRKANAEKLADVRVRYPNLAALVDDERLTLAQAIASAEQSDRDAAEEAARIAFEAAEKERIAQEEAARLQAEADAKLAEAERQKVEAERQAKANYEANRSAFHSALSKLFYGAGIVHNPVDCQDPTKWKGSWTIFHSRYQHPIQEFRDRLLALQERIPFILETLESMRDE